jgi:hypothetical protein
MHAFNTLWGEKGVLSYGLQSTAFHFNSLLNFSNRVRAVRALRTFNSDQNHSEHMNAHTDVHNVYSQRNSGALPVVHSAV